MNRARPDTDWAALDGLAAWFDCSVATMRRKLPELYAMGFPRPNPVINKWYLPECKKWAADEAVRNCQWRPALAVLRKAANWKAVRDKEDAELAAARQRWEQTSPESTDDDNFDRWLETNERDLAERLMCRTICQGRTFNWHKREAA